MHATEIAILNRRLRDDPRGVPYGYDDDELRAVCAHSRDETARDIASSLLRQRGQDVPEHATPKPPERRPDDRAAWLAAAEAHNAQRARERELEHARELLRGAGEME